MSRLHGGWQAGHWALQPNAKPQRRRPWLTLLTLLLVSGVLVASPVAAHSGGAPVLVEAPAGPYRVFAWLQPEPPRVGTVHLDVAVILAPVADAPTNPLVQPVTDATVFATWTPQGQPGAVVVVEASPQSGLNGYYYEMDTTLGLADHWRVELSIQGPAGQGVATFERQVLAARTANWAVIGGAALGLLALLGLMGLWNRLQAREPQVKSLSSG